MGRRIPILHQFGDWLPKYSFLIYFLFVLAKLSAAVVINEVCYDPDGNDEGYEWIELYNNGTANEQLEGAQISSAGQAWIVQYTLPAFILRPGRYLLIGGAQVPNTQFSFNFTFQNGGSESDGIRYRSVDGSYTDTVLYDEPNTFLLGDDSGNPGISFAPDAPQGCSLARIIDGYDTNNSGADFIAEPFPSPGTANPLRCDYAIGSYAISYTEGIADLSVWLKNNSYFSPLQVASFSITQGEVLYSAEINPIPANDSILIQATFACSPQNLILELILPDDPIATNNSISVSPGGSLVSGLWFNEFLADPDSGNQEWIELFSATQLHNRDGFSIRDAAGYSTNFLWSGQTGYFVICRYKDQFLQRYPNCPASNIIEASSWASLNNAGDSLILQAEGEVLDSLVYAGTELVKGVSRERYLATDDTYRWRNSLSPEGGTPGLPNSIPPDTPIPELGVVQLSGSPCNAQAGEIISIAYHLNSPSNRISCSVFDLRGSKSRTLADYLVSGESGVLYWDGRTQNGSFAKRGLYIILWESQAVSGGKILQKQLSAVVY